MSKVKIEVEDAKRFLQVLQRFKEEFASSEAHLSSRWQSLTATWNDQQYPKFSPSFSKFLAVNQKILNSCDDHTSVITQLIANQENALNKAAKFALSFAGYSLKTAVAGISGYDKGQYLNESVGVALAAYMIFHQTSKNIKDLRSQKNG